jgi:hypothetical protein
VDSLFPSTGSPKPSGEQLSRRAGESGRRRQTLGLSAVSGNPISGRASTSAALDLAGGPQISADPASHQGRPYLVRAYKDPFSRYLLPHQQVSRCDTLSTVHADSPPWSCASRALPPSARDGYDIPALVALRAPRFFCCLSSLGSPLNVDPHARCCPALCARTTTTTAPGRASSQGDGVGTRR